MQAFKSEQGVPALPDQALAMAGQGPHLYHPPNHCRAGVPPVPNWRREAAANMFAALVWFSLVELAPPGYGQHESFPCFIVASMYST